jgi:hypothetical protein
MFPHTGYNQISIVRANSNCIGYPLTAGYLDLAFLLILVNFMDRQICFPTEETPLIFSNSCSQPNIDS